MILSGNILLLLFILLKRVFKEFFDYELQNTILKICLIFFILPLSLIIDFINIVVIKLFGSVFIEKIQFRGNAPTIIFTDNNIITNPALHTIIAFFILWLFMTCIISGYHLFSYWKLRKFACISAEVICSDSLCSFLEEQAKALNIKRRIELYQNKCLISAYTMGTFRPVIILPANSSEAELKIIILHELKHVKNNDTLFLFLCLICKGIYWFNPLIYLLDTLLKQTTELVCDKWVTQQLNNDSKILYVHLIINMSRKKAVPARYSAYLTTNRKSLEERIDCIMKKTKKNNIRHFIATIAAIIATALSSIPAFANPSTQILSISAESYDATSYDSNVVFSFSTSNSDSDSTQDYPIIYDKQFTSINGQIFDRTEYISEPRLNCDHDFADGTYTRHELKSDGGCLTKYFEAWQCRKCGHLKIGSVTKEVSYVKCPH